MRPAGSRPGYLAALTLAVMPAQAPTAGCDDAPPVLRQLCQVAGRIGDGVSNTGGAVASSLGDAAVRAVTSWVIDGAVWFLDQVALVVTATTQVDTTAAFFTAHYAVMAGIAAAVALPLLLASIVSAVVHGDPARFGRAVAMTFAAGLGTFAAVTVTGLLLAVTDDLSARISAGMGADLRTSLHGVGTVLTIVGSVAESGTNSGTGAAVPLFAGFLAAVLIVIAAVGVWIELVLREVAIYAALLFFPLALAGLVWNATGRWARRLAEIIVSLILAKLVIVALLSLGMAGLASGGFSDVVAGAAMLLLALFSPWVVLRLVAVAESVAWSGVDGMRKRVTSTVGHRSQQGSDAIRSALSSSGGGSSGGGLTVAGAGSAAGGAAGGAAAGAAGVLAAGKAAADQVRHRVGSAAENTAAMANPYAPPPRPEKRGTASSRPPVADVESRLADASD
jgi:hypothetical protein